MFFLYFIVYAKCILNSRLHWSTLVMPHELRKVNSKRKNLKSTSYVRNQSSNFCYTVDWCIHPMYRRNCIAEFHFRATYPFGRKSRLNWLRLFYFMFDSAILNAYIVYIPIHKQTVHTSIFQTSFGSQSYRWIHRQKRTPSIIFRYNVEISGHAVIKPSSVPHYQEDQTKFTRHRIYSTKNTQKRSRIICDVCKVALSATPWFKSFHIALEGDSGLYHLYF